jgi:hypothetical protein
MTEIEHKEFSTKERAALEEKGQAMPGGRFPIRNSQDLKNAIQAYGRADDKPLVRAWIIKRARALGLTDLLPEGWVKMEAKQTAFMGTFLEHYGVKGMQWGVRRSRKQLERAAKGGSQGKSVKDMSDDELRSVVNRMNLEQQYSRLSSGGGGGNSARNRTAIAAGTAFLGSIALNVVRTQIQNQANQRIASAIASRAARRAAGG